MFLEIKNKESNYRKQYFDMLKYRLAYGSLELEGEEGDLADTTQSLKIYNTLDAIDYIFDCGSEICLKHFQFTDRLCKVVERVTGGEVSDFRKTKAVVNGSNVKRTEPNLIINDLYYLIDDYNYQISNCKTPDDIYEVEAQFHIRLLYIHPFEDGNGRTARIFLTHNLMKNNLAPCIITKEIKRKYCDLIENYDIKGLAEMFKELSSKELDTMVSLYKMLDEKGLIDDNIFSDDQEQKYREKVNE